MNSVSRSVKREQSKEDSTTHGGDDDDDDEVHILIMREMQRSEIQLRLEVISSISGADPGEKTTSIIHGFMPKQTRRLT